MKLNRRMFFGASAAAIGAACLPASEVFLTDKSAWVEVEFTPRRLLVSSDGRGNFKTLSAAVAVARAGETIWIANNHCEIMDKPIVISVGTPTNPLTIANARFQGNKITGNGHQQEKI